MLTDKKMLDLIDGLWDGGYYIGDPHHPYEANPYGSLGYTSILYSIYHACVKPYIKPDTAVLEIGPGRGAWTKTMLPAQEIWCLDALTAEHNKFWEYVGPENKGKVNYIRVSDFSCSDLPEDHFDFLFSFGTFCHIPWEGHSQYYENLFSKMKKGGTAMIMFGDFDKYNAAIKAYENVRIKVQPELSDLNEVKRNLMNLYCSLRKMFSNRAVPAHKPLDKRRPEDPEKGAWFHVGIEETCRFLESVGWEVVNPDVGLCPRDPIVHFRKPL